MNKYEYRVCTPSRCASVRKNKNVFRTEIDLQYVNTTYTHRHLGAMGPPSNAHTTTPNCLDPQVPQGHIGEPQGPRGTLLPVPLVHITSTCLDPQGPLGPRGPKHLYLWSYHPHPSRSPGAWGWPCHRQNEPNENKTSPTKQWDARFCFAHSYFVLDVRYMCLDVPSVKVYTCFSAMHYFV